MKTSVSQKKRSHNSCGLGASPAINPLIDPTKNVIDLTDAANRRQDDLRAAHERLMQSEIMRLDALRIAESARLDGLRQEESRRLNEQAVLRSEYESKLAIAEANRINAIRSVDVAAVAIASERASAQAGVLATQVAASAEALRTLVTSTASAMAQQAQIQQAQLADRLALLERSQYETKGRQGMADPMMDNLIVEMKRLTESRAAGEGRTAGVRLSWGVILGAAGLIGTAISALVFITKH